MRFSVVACKLNEAIWIKLTALQDSQLKITFPRHVQIGQLGTPSTVVVLVELSVRCMRMSIRQTQPQNFHEMINMRIGQRCAVCLIRL